MHASSCNRARSGMNPRAPTVDACTKRIERCTALIDPRTRGMDACMPPLERVDARHPLAHENHGPSNENLGLLHHGGARANAGVACANEKDSATQVRHSTFPSPELQRCNSDLHRSNSTVLACNPIVGACMFFVDACMPGARGVHTRGSTRGRKSWTRPSIWWTLPCRAVVAAPAWCIAATPTLACRCEPCATATRAVARASLTLAHHGATCKSGTVTTTSQASMWIGASGSTRSGRQPPRRPRDLEGPSRPSLPEAISCQTPSAAIAVLFALDGHDQQPCQDEQSRKVCRGSR